MPLTANAERSSPRTVGGNRPTVAALQREREYFDWLQELQPPPRDDMVLDDSWSRFMTEREQERSRQRAAQRREERWRKRGQSPPAEHVDARKKVQHEWEQACKRARRPAHAVHDKEMRQLFVAQRRKKRERARLRKITEQRQAAREAAGLSGRKRGRPVDPSSQRQQRLLPQAWRRS